MKTDMDCGIRFALAADKISRTARRLYADRYFDDTFNVGDEQILKQAYNDALDRRLGMNAECSKTDAVLVTASVG